jgi:hypothetical protein
MEKNYMIIGAGISGLYTAYNIRKKFPNAIITIVERDRIGGRMGLINFYGENVPIGAGGGRAGDKLLKKLLKELEIKPIKSKINSYFTFKKINIMNITSLLKREFKKCEKKYKKLTFKQFFFYVFEKRVKTIHLFYKLFIASSGFSDYENEDIGRTLYNYNMGDNSWNGVKYGINWNLLLDKLIKAAKSTIKCDNITKFKIIGDKIHVFGDEVYICDKLIIATAVDTLHKLIPGYEYIKGQSFLRVYAKFYPSPLLKNKMKEMGNPTVIITNSPLQKIIPINIKKNIYMISYADNKKADKLAPYIKNKKRNILHFEKLFNKTFFQNEKKFPKMKEIWGKYWKIGTHYFAPRDNFDKKKIQYPYKNVFIVGEMISEHQGWTEGALDSVEKIKSML